MRIGLDVRPVQRPNSRKRGVGRYTRDLVKAVLDVLPSSFQPLLYSTTKEIDFLRGDFKVEKTFSLRRPTRLNWLVDAFLLPGKIRRDRLALFQATEFLSIPVVRDVAVWAIVHDLIPFVFWEETVKRVPRDFVYALKRSLRALQGVEKILTISEASKNDICRIAGVPEDRVEIITLGLSGEFQPREEFSCRQRIRRDFDLESPFLLYVGGTDYRKNLPVLVDAFAQIRKSGYEGKLVMVGETFLWEIPEVSEIRERIRLQGLEGEVVLPGFVEDDRLIDLYNRADFLVFPSLYEGFGLPALEAMACGTSVLLAKNSSLPEVGGEAAFYFDADSAEDLVETFWQAREEPERVARKRQLGLELAQRYSWAEGARQIVELYRERSRLG